MSFVNNSTLRSEDGGANDYIASCPGEYEGQTSLSCATQGWKRMDFYPTPLVLSIVSCSLSLIGSGLIVLTYALWMDIRTGSRRIITYLSIADFVTALGYIMGSANFIDYRLKLNTGSVDVARACIEFDEVCQIQSFISTWSSNTSFLWTLILAVFFYWTIVRGEIDRVMQLFPLYHVIAWLFPLLYVIPLLVTHKFGYSVVASGGWCFIRTSNNPYQENPDGTDVYHSMSPETVGLMLAGGKLVEISTYIIVLVLYIRISYFIRKEEQPEDLFATNGNPVTVQLRKIENKLLAIPIVFILLRMWGSVQFLVSIVVFNIPGAVGNDGCVSLATYVVYYILAVLQSIGDGGQGWGNAILYIMLAPRIRNRLCVRPCKRCCEESVLLGSLPTGLTGNVNRPTWNSTRRSLSYGIIGRSEPVSNSSVPDRSTASLIADMHEREILLAEEDSNRQQSSHFANT